MWRHVQIRKTRRRAATRIAATWRGYCVRLNQRFIHDCANRLRRAFQTFQACRQASTAVVDLFELKRALWEERVTPCAVQIQRAFRRRYQLKEQLERKRVRRAVISLQARTRGRIIRREVRRLRSALGPDLTRLPFERFVLEPDRWGRLTRFRSSRVHDALPQRDGLAQHTVRIVNLQLVPKMLQEDLASHIAPLQAFAKYKVWEQRLTRAQGRIKAWLTRRSLGKEARSAAYIQAVWRTRAWSIYGGCHTEDTSQMPERCPFCNRVIGEAVRPQTSELGMEPHDCHHGCHSGA